MGYISLLTVSTLIFALHSYGVRSAYIHGYDDKDAPVETGHQNSPMNYVPEELFQGELPQAAHPEYTLPEEMEGEDKLPEIIIPAALRSMTLYPHSLNGVIAYAATLVDRKAYKSLNKVERNKVSQWFPYFCLADTKVEERHHRRGRRRCKDRKSEQYCYHILLYGRCQQKRGKRQCRRTCGECEDERECRDVRNNCYYASAYTCSQPWFAQGCRSSCNLCETKPTVTTTTAEPEQECKDIRSNCEYANKYTCSYWRIRWGCKKSCGVCVPEQTTTAPSTTAATTEVSSSTSPTRPTTTHLPSRTPTTTAATRPTTNPDSTTEPQPPTLEPETVQSTIATTTTVSMITTKSGSGSTDTTSRGTIEPLLCVDQDEKNCHIWESLGLCYNPKFMEDTIKICPFSCKACTPEDSR